MQTDTGYVYKYFDLLDGFVRVRQVEEGAHLSLPADQQLPPDRRHYRRWLVRFCLQRPEEVLARVQTRYPEEMETVEDLLYRICVDVNPHLEIHAVTLPAPGSQAQRENSAAELAKQQSAWPVQGLERRLKRVVFGQDEAIEAVSQAIQKAACGLNDPNRPVATMLFVGRTGCGKTELAKAIARELQGERPLVRVDCSEYGQAHETARLTGAPPGYVGYQSGGALTEALKENPRSVVLFDEIEKGHERLHHLLLQVLDEGRLTDGRGETVDLREAIILLTSNVGTDDYHRAQSGLGFRETSPTELDFQAMTHEALTRSFRPEFINRLDAVLTFRALSDQSCEQIVRARLEQIRQRLAGAGAQLSWTAAAVKRLTRLGMHDEYGARELHRTVDLHVEQPLSAQILSAGAGKGMRFRVRSQAGELKIEREAA